MTFNTSSAEQWRAEQNKYTLRLKNAMDRLISFDQMSVGDVAVTWNA